MIRIFRPDGTSYSPTTPATVKPPHPPFDQIRGETFEGLGDDFVVVPPTRWMDTPVLDIAMDRAKKALTGYRLAPIQAEMLVQEYHSRDILLIVVAIWGKAPGKLAWQWHYVATPIEIKGETKVDLVLSGRWKTSTRH